MVPNPNLMGPPNGSNPDLMGPRMGGNPDLLGPQIGGGGNSNLMGPNAAIFGG